LACHDLRTPLATAHGFARTLERTAGLDADGSRYLEMIGAASEQLAEILDTLSLVARIEAGRWEPNVQRVDSLELARTAAADVDAGEVSISGGGGSILVDEEALRDALRDLARCVLRHGGLKRVELVVDGGELTLSPVAEAVAPIVLGESLRDLGAAVAVRVLRASGGSVEIRDEELRIAFSG
jgi:signal transduction histidine kinase